MDGGTRPGGGAVTCNETLPALPGGVGVLSDRLAELSGQIAECGDILEEYRQIMTRARLMEQGYGKENA